MITQLRSKELMRLEEADEQIRELYSKSKEISIEDVLKVKKIVVDRKGRNTEESSTTGNSEKQNSQYSYCIYI